MMKISKPSHKLHKSSRSSPIRKEHLMKKPPHSSAPMRVSGTSRTPIMKRISPGMKRGPSIAPSKSMHSPRLRSIASSPHRSLTRHSIQDSAVDRTHGLKRPKFEKRKISPSPIRHPMASPRDVRNPAMYRDERYLNNRPVPRDGPFSPPPPKKKPRREPDRFERGGSSIMMRRSEIPMHSEGRMPHRSEAPPRPAPTPSMSHNRGHVSSLVHDERSDRFNVHNRGRAGPPPAMASNHVKRAPQMKSSYDARPDERYQGGNPVAERYPPSGEKHYTQTLHERFSTVVDSTRTEPRIKYSREDLEKITIDIHRNIKSPSPTLRHIVNPSKVKLVRRANEGHRPIFDRDEIKQATRDMREDAHYEKKVPTGSGYSSMHPMNREVENYEITRHRFDSHHAPLHSSSGRSLSDRWQNSEGRKEGTTLDRDDREYERQTARRSYSEARRSKSADRDFRSERYSGMEMSRGRPAYHTNQHRVPSSAETRSSVPVHHKEAVILDARRKLGIRRGSDREPPTVVRLESRGHYPPVKRFSEGVPPSRVEKHYSDRRSPAIDPHKWLRKSRSGSRDRLPEFSRRPDKYSHKSWSDKGDISPRRGYFELDSHDDSESYRGRGSSRPFRSARGLRTRGPRGISRGSFPIRSFRGGYRSSSSIRGRGVPRRGRMSPGFWEHDLYARSDDRKMDHLS